MTPEDLVLEPCPIGHLPLIRAVVDDLGIVSVLDERCPKHPLSVVSDADCVVLMILNLLSGRVALHRMNDWLERTDAEILLGTDRPASAFHDTRLEACLDHLAAVGTDLLLGDVVDRYLTRPDLPRAWDAHQDTTSVTVFGDYDLADEPLPTYGFSKDHRPDLRQLIFGLTLHGSAGIPVLGTMLDGNTSDVTVNRIHLAALAERLPEPGQVTLIADCKLVDAETVGQVLDAGLHFVSLLPDTFDLRRQAIEGTWEADPDVATWPLLLERPGPTKDAPPEQWRGWSAEHPFLVRRRGTDGTVVEEARMLRALVVHSTSAARRFEDSLTERMEKERETIAKAEAKVGRQPYRCAEDARKAAEKQAAGLRFHQAAIAVTSVARPLKRGRAGRPKKDEPVPTETVWTVAWTLSRDEDAIAAERRRASCFVLLTDHTDDEEGWDDGSVLAAYKRQHLVEGATGFHWLKGPAAVAPVFLKTPARIRALGLVFLLALMVRNHLQFTLRRKLVETGDTLLHPFTKKGVQNPTTEIALVHFGGVTTLRQTLPSGEVRRLPTTLRPPARKILDLLGFSPEIFTVPPDGRSRRRGNPKEASG